MKTNILRFIATKKFFGFALGALILSMLVFMAMRASAENTINVTAVAQNSSNVNITTTTIGSMVHSVALVASSTGPMATGTVDFQKYQNTTCTGSPTTESGLALVNGNATSSSIALPNTGLSYIAHYNGNNDYPAMNSNCVGIAATASADTLSTTLSTTTSVLSGSVVHDSATLSAATSNAGGTVAYTVYTNNACTAGAIGAGTGAVTNGIVADSSSLQFTALGTYYWQAVYSGDASNAAATSTCGSEVLTVVSVPAPVTNTAPVIQLLGANPFNLVLGQTFTDPGASSTDVQDGDLTSHIVKTGTVNTNVVGTTVLTYVVTDSGGLSATTTRTVVVASTSPMTGAGVISGNVFNDENKNLVKDGGEAGLSGWSINLYKGAGWWGRGHKNSPIVTVTTDANGNYSFNNLPDGVYSVEQIINKGWIQETGDFRSITITNGGSKTDANFADFAKTPKKANPPPTPPKNFKDFRFFWNFWMRFHNHNGNNGNGNNNNGNQGNNKSDNDNDNDGD